MDGRAYRDIALRLARLERECVRLRQGTLTGANAVAVGGASTSFADVAVVGGAASGDRVSALTAGNDILVIGPYRFTSGTTAVSVSAATNGSATVTHGLGTTPDQVIATGLSLNAYNVTVASKGATTFLLQVRHIDATSTTTTVNVDWLAIRKTI